MGDVDVSGSLGVTVYSDSQIGIKGIADSEPIHIAVDSMDALRIKSVAPVAAHIKEIDKVAPLSIETAKIDGISNIDALRVTTFDITNLPAMNLSLRQLPQVDLNLRQLPALSVGTHQRFTVPSSYTLRAHVLGFEVLRVQIEGATHVLPEERARRELSRTPDRSQPIPATAGNPAIPSIHKEVGAHVVHPAHPYSHHSHPNGPRSGPVRAAMAPSMSVSLSRGDPRAQPSFAEWAAEAMTSSLSSGD
ncbi:MAG: hypothetical protein HUU21_11630 [Polyangiaceae bacterium]|nr:hypothetical protein [Polyangiaceae bacterium]NUQ74197.1 hypothetical protein [Polyangiaceae bacterium]